MSITFNDKTEALEFAKRLVSDGYEFNLTKKNGIYYVEKGQYLGRGHIRGIHFGLEDEDIIINANKSSTLEKLHELGHRESGHKGLSKTVSESINREIEAEEWGRKKIGKEIDIVYVENLVDNLAKEGYWSSASNIMNSIEKSLKEKGYELSTEQKSSLWERLKKLDRRK